MSGTGQYPQLARDRELKAFVVADIEQRGKRLAMTFLVWQGIDGSVVGRWELAAYREKLASVLRKEFWRRLGPAIAKALAPPSTRLGPAPPMRVDAGSPYDSDVEGVAWRRRWNVRKPVPVFLASPICVFSRRISTVLDQPLTLDCVQTFS